MTDIMDHDVDPGVDEEAETHEAAPTQGLEATTEPSPTGFEAAEATPVASEAGLAPSIGVGDDGAHGEPDTDAAEVHSSFDDEDDDDDDPPHLARFMDDLDESDPLAADVETPTDPPEIPVELIDADALWVVRRLRAKGYEAYLTGGCVRDLLLGRPPKDFDVATAAHPEQVKSVFRNCRLIGRRFRLAHVYFPNGKVIETATFRANPLDLLEDLPEDLLVERDNVFGSVEEDARRRDLTINGLFYDPLAGKVLDFVDGRRDLEQRLIRTIGDPNIRFQEDPVRILRAIKFATRLGFDFEPETLEAMRQHVDGLARCAAPRLLEELHRLLVSGFAQRSFQLCQEVGVLRVLLPELTEVLEQDVLAPFAPSPDAESVGELDHETPAPVADSASAAPENVAAMEAPSDDAADEHLASSAPSPVQADEAAAQAASAEEEGGLVAPTLDDHQAPSGQDEEALAAPAGHGAEPLTPAERQHRFEALLASLDEVRARKAEVSSAVSFTALLLSGFEAHASFGNDAMAWLDDVTARWTERIRLTRHDRETARYLLRAQEQMQPENRRGSGARHLVGRPWFREALLLLTLSLHARGQDLGEIGRWKVVAAHYKQAYKQPRHGERVAKPRRMRRSRRGGDGGGRRGGRRRG